MLHRKLYVEQRIMRLLIYLTS